MQSIWRNLPARSFNLLLLGLDPLEDAIRRGAGQPLDALLDDLVATARAHGQQTDDQTVLLVRYS